MPEVITNNLGLWTSALLTKSTAGRGSNGKLEAYGIKKLRELILELAVRGKLVPQDPNDEPASVLLEKIAKEKNRLIKEGRIKKQESLPEIGEDERPFKLPQGWTWTRLGNLSSNVHYGYTASANHGREGIRLLRITDIQNDVVNWTTVPGCDIEADKADDFLLENDDILIARTGGTIGKSYLVEDIDVKAVFASYLIRVKRIDGMYSSFIKTFLGSQVYWHQLYANSMGTGQPNVNATALRGLVVPIPSLAEQHRIVTKANELMALCDQLERQQTNNFDAHQTLVEILLGTLTRVESQQELTAAWNRITNHFDTLFTTEQSIDQLKQTILQLAVMGDLVPQDPNDEPASVLLKKIAEEKERLVRQGVIKKQQPLLLETDGEKPFEIPERWKWTRLGNVGIGSTGKTPSTGRAEYYGGEIPFIGPGQITPAGAILDSDKTLTEEGCDYSVCADPGDILMVCIGGSIGKSAIAVKKIAFNQQINCISPILVSSVFLNYSMNTLHFRTAVLEKASGSATPIINRSKWEELLVPIPPEAEQHRIVAKVDELMVLCDALKARLNDAQTIQINLADAIVEQAVL